LSCTDPEPNKSYISYPKKTTLLHPCLSCTDPEPNKSYISYPNKPTCFIRVCLVPTQNLIKQDVDLTKEMIEQKKEMDEIRMKQVGLIGNIGFIRFWVGTRQTRMKQVGLLG
jgi:hypothetical protein